VDSALPADGERPATLDETVTQNLLTITLRECSDSCVSVVGGKRSLFYRELGFELKQITRVLGRADSEVVSALLA